MAVRKRSKAKFSSSRSAWRDIANKTRATSRTHRIKAAHTKTHFTWTVTRK